MTSIDVAPNAFPKIDAHLSTDGTAKVFISGAAHDIAAADLPSARVEVVSLIAQTAAQLGRPVRVQTFGPDGQWPIIVHADESVDEDATQPAHPAPVFEVDPVVDEDTIPVAPSASGPAASTSDPDSRSRTSKPAPVPVIASVPAAKPIVAAPAAHAAAAASAVVVAPPETPRREVRQSFLTQENTEEPATQGWRGSLTRFGIRMSPSESERAERADVLAVSQHWPGPRTIAVVNGKGGAGKTPTTVLLAAVFARFGGSGVLAWDNNQTRGTLGWRTEQGKHEATLLDLLPQVPRLLSTGAQSADLNHFVHHQSKDKFDVLRSKPMALAHEQRVEPSDVDAIHDVAAKYYRLIFIDSGNDESDPMWLRMIDKTDQLVVATTTRDDHAEAGALLLEALAERDQGSAELARDAVVIVSQADPNASAAELAHVANGYKRLARAAVTIPHDPAIVDGVLNYGALRPSTQRAGLAAGAAVARGL